MEEQIGHAILLIHSIFESMNHISFSYRNTECFELVKELSLLRQTLIKSLDVKDYNLVSTEIILERLYIYLKDLVKISQKWTKNKNLTVNELENVCIINSKLETLREGIPQALKIPDNDILFMPESHDR